VSFSLTPTPKRNNGTERDRARAVRYYLRTIEDNWVVGGLHHKRDDTRFRRSSVIRGDFKIHAIANMKRGRRIRR